MSLRKLQSKKFGVYEDILYLIFETNDRDKAVVFWKDRHKKFINLYHEIWRLDEDGLHGIYQYKPGDIVKDVWK